MKRTPFERLLSVARAHDVFVACPVNAQNECSAVAIFDGYCNVARLWPEGADMREYAIRQAARFAKTMLQLRRSR